MKKHLLTAVAFLASLFANATTYYISVSGNDNTGNGTVGNPWKTLYKATASVSTSGDIIHVNAGTYTETQQSDLAVGVSLEGSGAANTTIKSTLSTYFTPIIRAASNEGTNGNQHISDLKFDGNNLTTSFAIDFKGRSNVSIYDCIIENFEETGVIMTGQNNNAPGAPSIYATGCSFHDNVMSNNAKCDGVWGRGNFMFGGTDGILIYNNVITQNQRVDQTNGWPIKGWCDSFIKNTKIYGNTLVTQHIPAGKANGQDGFWDFAIELFDSYGGNEIYNNTMTGSIDLNRQQKTSFAYSWKIYNNIIGFSTMPVGRQSGIILEYSTETAIIENNTIRNVADGINFSFRNGSSLTNTKIQKNLLYNVGCASGGYGYAIGNHTDGSNNWTGSNVDILNNTVVAYSNSSYAPFDGINFNGNTSINNFNIKNNIIQGFNQTPINASPIANVSNSSFQYNTFYLNANNNQPFTAWDPNAQAIVTQTLPGGNTLSNNLLGTNPLFVSTTDFHLQAGSPCIDAGINVGLTYSGSAPDIGYVEYVSGSNNPPIANAGANQTITLPTSAVTLNGSGTDTDGTITAYAWTQQSGPNTATLTNSTTANLTAGGLIAGSYVFKLTVTDNQGATGFSTVTVTVTPQSTGVSRVHYVSTTGNDNTGTGSYSNPWKTLYHATQTVTLAGDTIIVLPGTYTETQQSHLALGVNLEGSGSSNTIIKSTLSAQWVPIISLPSSEGTIGNQHISNLTLDGDNLTTSWAISITGRSNVSIYNCTIVNFMESGVMWSGKVNYGAGAPTIYATGNSFHDNIVTNCATADGLYGRGCFQFGGQDGMLIYNNTITNNSRPDGQNGWPIKNCNEGFTKNCKIYNNTLIADVFPYPYNGANNYWNFAVELFDESGMEIYGNTIEGSVDFNHQYKGSSAYSVYIHDNVIGHNTPAATWEDGIILEYETNDAIIEKNTIKNCMDAISFSLRTGSTMNNVRINNNLAYNIGISDATKQGYAIRIITNDNVYSADNFQILNNTFVAITGANSPFFGINLPSGTSSTNIKLINNIATNFDYYVVTANQSTNINNLEIKNNNFYNNGSNNGFNFPNGLPINYVNSGNISVNPMFVSLTDYHLQATSPCIDAGVNVGIAYNGTAPDMGWYESGTITNNPPTANAGANQTITLPTSSVTVNGSGTDTDGTITGYAWSQQTGPNTAILSGATTTTLNASGLIAGTYVFKLTVTDNNGATGTSTVTITVNLANIAPVANAGTNQTITLPTNFTTLSGSASYDLDGIIISYKWKKISGPNGGKVSTTSAVTKRITDLRVGTYTYSLTVTDNKNATNTAIVKIVVQPIPSRVNIINARKNDNDELANPSLEEGAIVTQELLLFPNPSTSELYLLINNDSDETITIHDELGRIIKTFFTKNNGSSLFKMDLENMAMGSYYLTSISNTTGKIRKARFIKQ